LKESFIEWAVGQKAKVDTILSENNVRLLKIATFLYFLYDCYVLDLFDALFSCLMALKDLLIIRRPVKHVGR